MTLETQKLQQAQTQTHKHLDHLVYTPLPFIRLHDYKCNHNSKTFKTNDDDDAAYISPHLNLYNIHVHSRSIDGTNNNDNNKKKKKVKQQNERINNKNITKNRIENWENSYEIQYMNASVYECVYVFDCLCVSLYSYTTNEHSGLIN